jgi:hypothetical protein
MFSLGTNALFHREAAGDNRFFPSIARTQLVPLKTLSATQAQMVSEGVLRND